MRLRFVLLPLGFALCFVPLSAQAQAAAAAPATAPVAIIDPAARHVFAQMVIAQKALRSFAITVETQDQAAQGKVSSAEDRSRIAFAAPARAFVTFTRKGKVLGQMLSDGAVLTRVDSLHKQYRTDALPAADAARLVGEQVGSLGLLPSLFATPDRLTGLLSGPGLVAVARGPATDPIGGVSVDSVVTRLIGSDGSEGTFTFLIGQSDHLLHQVIVHEALPAGKHGAVVDTTHTETITALEVNPSLPASDFEYHPQSGFKKVVPAR